MITVKVPFRISFFGGSTDYKEFYSKYGAYLIGTTIDKYVYLTMRKRPAILGKKSIITYSQVQQVETWNEIHNPLIREILKWRKIDVPIEFFSFSDIPSRTGLGGSSSFCVGMLYLIDKVFGLEEQSPKNLAKEAILIERELLQEAGGIQDQIWPAYGGFNSLEIWPSGEFYVKPVPVTREFQKELERSMILIYTNEQREQDSIAKSHIDQDKMRIAALAQEAQKYFNMQDIRGVGKLLHQSWEEKKKISPLISTGKINDIVEKVMSMDAYGVKLLGAGGCGFVLVICNPIVRQNIQEVFNGHTMDFSFENNGVTVINKE